MSRREIAAALASYLVVQVIALALIFTVDVSSREGSVDKPSTRVCWQADSQRYCWSPSLRVMVGGDANG